MLNASGYREWGSIVYAPVIAAHCPEDFVATVRRSASVLDLGCHDGAAAMEIARMRPDVAVLGIDINASAIEAASRVAERERVRNVSFEVRDVLRESPRQSFDAVLTIRVLTCLPDLSDWSALLGAIERLLSPGGRWYAVDYLFDSSNPAYAERYAAGERAGWRRGNFQVASPRFTAHHHTEEEIELLARRFAVRRFLRFESRSMHGNPASMFELIAARREGAS